MKAIHFLLFSTLCIIDISCQNSNVVIDLKYTAKKFNALQVRETGVKGVIHLATQSINIIDPYYEIRKRDALKYNLLWGAYHIADGTSGREQAKFFLRTVGKNESILMALGIEKSDSSMNLKEAEEFVRTVYEERKRYPLVYGNEYLASLVKENTDSILTKCGLWIYQYQDDVLVPKGWKNWTLWQYSDGIDGPEPHSVSGVKGPVGRDKINLALNPTAESLWNKY